MQTTKKEYIDKYGYKVTEESNENNQLIKKTHYKSDGKTVWCIDEYNLKTGVKTKTTYYNADGTIKSTSKPAFVTTTTMLVIAILVTVSFWILALVF